IIHHPSSAPSTNPSSPAQSIIHHPSSLLFGARLCFGLALLMKQHGIFFCLFGVAYLLWTKISPRLDLQGSRLSTAKFQVSTFNIFLFSAALVLPYLLTLLILSSAGALHQFI